MTGHNLLEATFRDILHVIKPSKEDWAIRFHIIDEIRDIVGSIESLRGATVEPYGSFVSDLFTKWGDLDISIELHNGSYITSHGKKHKQSLLADVQRALRNKGGFRRRLQFIRNARVPILKFETIGNISCDLSVNNLSGQMKSKVLYWINDIDWRFRDLVLLVKEWARTHGINDSKSGSLNSYSISLLVIFHFQTLVPAILPPLSEIYPGNMSDDLTGVRAVAEKRIEDICGANINRIKSDRLRLINRCSLSDLFTSFLAKFSIICSSAATEGISTHAGRLEEINTNMRWLPKTYALLVEDPFEQPANTARTVSSSQLARILAAIHETRGALAPANKDPMSLVSVLVGPHVLSRLVPMPPPGSTSMMPPPGSTSMMRPRGQNGFKRLGPEEKQGHHMARNERADRRPSGAQPASPRQASTSQKQQVWRPKSKAKLRSS